MKPSERIPSDSDAGRRCVNPGSVKASGTSAGWGTGSGVVGFVRVGLGRLGAGRRAILQNRSLSRAKGAPRLRRLGDNPVIIVLLWVVPYFLITGSFAVKYMRYMQPIVPLLVIFGAALLVALARRLAARQRAAAVAPALVLAFTALYAVAFAGIYNQEHPWNTASRWVYANVPPRTTLLSEQWDDYLPATMVVDGVLRRREEFPNTELTWLSRPYAADD